MCSKIDSDATYCSEVEKLLTAGSTPLNNNKNLPLRRSQRLSEKRKDASGTNKSIAEKVVLVWNGVPLDLSHKPRESTVETPILKIDEAVTTTNVLQDVKIKYKEIARPHRKIYTNKSQRPRTSRNVSRNKIVEEETLKAPQKVKLANYSNQPQQEHINFTAEDVTRTRSKCFENQSTNKNGCDEKVKSGCAMNKFRQSKTVRPGRIYKKKCYHGIVSMEISESFKRSKAAEALKINPININLFGKQCNNINPCERGRKRKHTTGEIAPKSSTDYNKKPNIKHNKIKVSAETKDKISNFAVDSNVSLPTKIEQTNNTMVLRSQSAIRTKQLCGQVDTNINFAKEHNKIKMEKLSQISYEEGIYTNKCVKKIPLAKANKVCCQSVENKFSKIKVKDENEVAKKHTKLSNETDKAPKTLKSLQKVKQNTEYFQNKIQLENSTLKKNYIKSFNKNQFVDKIRNARSYVEHLSVENHNLRKVNYFQIPPSPAGSSDELLKNAILHHPYPEHFKYQLPPEAILNHTLDPQPLPTPDDTISADLFDSSSSSPSLPESLCELFKTKDIKDILNLKQSSYHLNSYHIQALALILNLQVEYLLKILDKVMDTSPAVLKNVEKAVKTPFVPDNDVFSNSSHELWNSSNVVQNSQSPKH